MTEYIPPLFKNFGKGLTDLFKKQFDYKKSVTVKTSTSNGLTLETQAETAKAGDFAGSLKSTYKQSDVGVFEAELHTSGSTKYSVKADKLTKNLVVKVSGDEKPSGKVEVDYAQDFFSSSLTVDVAKESTAVDTAGVIGFDGLSVGGHVKYDVTRQQLADFNAGTEYSQSDFTVTVKTTDQANKIATSYLHKISADVQAGAHFSYDLESGKRLLAVGGSQRFDSQSFGKAKLDTNGILSLALEQKLKNPLAKLVFSAEFNARQASTVPDRFGLGVHLGDD